MYIYIYIISFNPFQCIMFFVFQRLIFSVRDFDLEESVDCKISAFMYFDGNNTYSSPFIYCGPRLPRITRSTSNVVIFQLQSNAGASCGAFRIDYSAVSFNDDSPYLMLLSGEMRK